MRGRILLTIILGTIALGACSKRDSLFIEPGKDERTPKRERTPQKPAPEKPAPVKS